MEKIKQISKVKNFIMRFIFIVFSTVGIISLSTIVALNSTVIYREIIRRYNLSSVTGITAERLMINYKGLIDYLQNPFISKLKFEDFAMSNAGEIHFYEVKKIFLIVLGIATAFTICIIVVLIFSEYKKVKFTEIIKTLNISANVIVVFFIAFTIIFVTNFSWGFTAFHKIFFRNNYWLFDPRVDPVINALPEELFFVYGAIILGIILITSIIIKIVYYKSKIKQQNSKLF